MCAISFDHRDSTDRASNSHDDAARVQLAELEHLYRTAPVGLCFVDRDLRYVRINEQLAALHGSAVRAHVGRTIREILPEIADNVEQIYNRVIQTGEPVLNIEVHGVTAAEPGVERDWLASYFPFRGEDGAVIGVTAAVVEITARKAAERKLLDYADRLQTLSAQLLEVQETERRHLACELHDEVGQMLTGLRLLLKPDGDTSSESVTRRLYQAQQLVDEILERVRGLSFDLRPAALDELGLLPALITLVERYTNQTGVKVNLKHNDLNRRLASETETTAYRIVQEGLTNVARHANVHQVMVRIWIASDLLHVQIQDHGVGFDADAALTNPRTTGLTGMRERAHLSGGQLTIESRSGAGTQLLAELPLRSPAAETNHGNHGVAG
jgi:PAS domain S-box-containing protein